MKIAMSPKIIKEGDQKAEKSQLDVCLLERSQI